MNEPDGFDDWLRTQQMDLRGQTPEGIASVRRSFESVRLAVESARASTMFGKPCPAGEQRYAIAIEDGNDLRLGLVIRRSGKGEYFFLIPRGGDWDPHASYHNDGTYHHKSHDLVIGNMPKRQLLGATFKGAEHLGSFHCFGTAAPICHRGNFTSVLVIPAGVLEGTEGCALIDLVEPGVQPNPIHREGRQIYREITYREGSPWIVVAIVAEPIVSRSE
jgi:hypothetical protein